MANRIEDINDEFDTIEREEWIHAEVPSETLMGDAFPKIQINGHNFEAGFSDDVPPGYAAHIKVLTDGVQREAVRRLQPKKDIKSLLQQSGGSSGPKSIKAMP